MSRSRLKTVFALLSEKRAIDIVGEAEAEKISTDPVVRSILALKENYILLGSPRPADAFEEKIICIETADPHATKKALATTPGIICTFDRPEFAGIRGGGSANFAHG